MPEPPEPYVDRLLELAEQYLDATGREDLTTGELLALWDARASVALDRDQTFSVEDPKTVSAQSNTDPHEKPREG